MTEEMNARITAQEKAEDISQFMVGRRFRHFKGNVYMVVGIGVHSETAELMVIYIKEGCAWTWVRPYEMFMSDVDREKYPNATQEKRFEMIAE